MRVEGGLAISKSLKVNKDGFCKEFFHAPHFVVPQAGSGPKFFTALSLHISNIYAKKGIAKNIIQTLRAIMTSQDIDLVAGDFNGTAWRCRSRDNLTTIDEVFADCSLPSPPGSTPLWDLDPSRTVGLTSVDF